MRSGFVTTRNDFAGSRSGETGWDFGAAGYENVGEEEGPATGMSPLLMGPRGHFGMTWRAARGGEIGKMEK